MFQNFSQQDLEIDGIKIHYRIGGYGPYMLMLHGFPKTIVFGLSSHLFLLLNSQLFVRTLEDMVNRANPQVPVSIPSEQWPTIRFC